MEKAQEIYDDRMNSWNQYYEMLKPLAEAGYIELPYVPEECIHNAHMFYIKAKDLEERTKLIEYLKTMALEQCSIIFRCTVHRQAESLVNLWDKISTRPRKVKDL